jgi:SAM-dependent methyltransferase
LEECKALVKAEPAFRQALVEILKNSYSRKEAANFLAEIFDDELLVQVVRKQAGRNDSLIYAQHVFAEIDFLVRKYLSCRPRQILEIGPGVNLGALFCFVASGVERAVGVDIEPMTLPPDNFYVALKDYLSCVEGFAWWRSFDSQEFPLLSFPHTADVQKVEDLLRRIEYRSPVSSAELPFADDSFDVVYSVAVLEHIPEPVRTLKEIQRTLRKGGVCIHEIDLRHHGAADPLRFLEWSEDEYRAKAQPYGEGRSLRGILDGAWQEEVFCNRLRLSDWLELFHDAGFEILEQEPVAYLDTESIRPERFVEPFRTKSLEDLAVLDFRIVARRCP